MKCNHDKKKSICVLSVCALLIIMGYKLLWTKWVIANQDFENSTKIYNNILYHVYIIHTLINDTHFTNCKEMTHVTWIDISDLIILLSFFKPLFPYLQIRNLGCNCKLCVHCVKENFEIMIRERHVRNMNCPMCSLPDMENIDEASDYLAFLTLLVSYSKIYINWTNYGLVWSSFTLVWFV